MRPALGPARARGYSWRPMPLIERSEVTSLLFNVSDIVVAVETIVDLLKEDDDGEEEADEG